MKGRRYSVARARAELPDLLRAVERGAEVEITRRGEPVAVILSVADRSRLASGRRSFRDAHAAFLADTPMHTGVSRSYFSRLRDRSAGRKVKL